jgi:hypothetical protein
VFDSIERFYNAICMHSTIGYVSPIAFEQKVKLAELCVCRTGSRPFIPALSFSAQSDSPLRPQPQANRT